MSEQVQAQKATQTTQKPQEPTTEPVPQPEAHKLSQEASDLLDEIDELLEPNAQEFVEGFIQKGGE